ncbi:hypothetical protein D3C81_1937020 [compost metagenome]
MPLNIPQAQGCPYPMAEDLPVLQSRFSILVAGAIVPTPTVARVAERYAVQIQDDLLFWMFADATICPNLIKINAA